MVSESSVNNYDNKNAGDTSDDDFSDAAPNNYFKNISLRYFSAEPLRMALGHTWFKEQCLEHGNAEAHYIEGIIQYFFHKKRKTGLHHLRQASIGKNVNGTYLYGVLMLSIGHYAKGKKYLDKLQWQKKQSTSDHCWARIKNSLSAIKVPLKMEYYTNMVKLKKKRSCGHKEMDQVCKKCYYFKRLKQFVTFAIHRK